MWDTANRLLGPLYLGLTVAAGAGLGVGAVSGRLGISVAALGVALVAEVYAAVRRRQAVRMLDRLGVTATVRGLTRSVAVAVALGVAQAPAMVIVLYGLVAVATVPATAVLVALVDRVRAAGTLEGVRNIGGQHPALRSLNAARRASLLGRYAVLAAEWVAAAGLAVVVATHASVAAAAVVALPAVAGMVVIVGGASLASGRLRRADALTAYRQSLLDELDAFAPDAIVYMSAGAGHSRYMLNQWLPAFAAMNKRAVVVVRERSNVAPIADTDLPIVYARRTRDVEQLVRPSVRLAFYLANAGANVQLQREPRVRHIFLNHGDSDKATSANPVSRVYDEVWVAGQAAIDRYAAAGIDIPRERFAIVGRPQVARLSVGPRSAGGERRLLYAPTFEGNYEEANYSSLETMGPAMIRMLLEQRPGLTIVFKPHPATGRHRPGTRAAMAAVNRLLADAGGDHIVVAPDDARVTLYDCFEMSDLLLADISSVVTDYLHTERPILVTNPKTLPAPEFTQMFPTQRASYIVGPGLDNLIATVDEALADDPLRDERKAMKRYVLGDLPHGPIAAFAGEVDRAYEAAQVQAERVRNAFTFADGPTPGP